MGWNRAATLNLNIRYGKLSLALIAQAAAYQLRSKLPNPYSKWSAKHLVDSLFRGIDGDLRVKNDTSLPQRLEKGGVNPKIPWLFDLKVDLRFK